MMKAPENHRYFGYNHNILIKNTKMVLVTL